MENYDAVFRRSTVAVCGLGGLGSHIALALARAGVGKLILADFDRVDASNLHRQQYALGQVGQYKTEAMRENILTVAPETAVEIHTLRLTEENVPSLLGGADVICEAFDRPEEKAMLTEAVLTGLPEAYLVAASGMAGLHPANAIRTRRLTPRFYLCGDGVSDVADYPKLFEPRVMLCAAHQAHMTLRLLAGEREV